MQEMWCRSGYIPRVLKAVVDLEVVPSVLRLYHCASIQKDGSKDPIASIQGTPLRLKMFEKWSN